jgi:hypothetical protein
MRTGKRRSASGIIVGINMIFGGSALVAMALHARTSSPDTSAAGSRQL